MMPVVRIALLLFLFAGLASCTKVTSEFLNEDQINFRSVEEGTSKGRSPCHEYLNYVRDTLSLAKWPNLLLRVNVHFMNSEDSTQNIPEEEAADYARAILENMNRELGDNRKMFLPPGNNTPVIPIPFRHVLTPRGDIIDDDGIYYHYDDALYFYLKKGKHRNNTSREVIDKYGVDTDSVINIFLMPHHRDSVESPTYYVDFTAIALGTSTKAAAPWKDKPDPWHMIPGQINHEIGHLLGLAHSWVSNDGCDDTPQHSNCWNFTEEPPCDSLVSNNLMDYNAYQSALTPCQIGRMLRTVSSLNSRQRNLVIPTWCQRDSMYDVYVQDSIVWGGALDIFGSVTIAPGASLEVMCRLSIPEEGKITVQPGGRLVLNDCLVHNACGLQWEGIEIQSKGRLKGEVVFIGGAKVENSLHGIGSSEVEDE